MDGTLYITGRADTDRLLNHDPFALLIGMLLDQQVPMEWAFQGPATLEQRLGGLAVGAVAAMPEDELVAVACAKPAIHRFPAVMAKRIHELAVVLDGRYEGDAAALWRGVATGDELYRRLHELPGFGDEKSRIFVALLAKRMGVRPAGWRETAGKFGDDVPRSVADSDGPASLERVRAWKKAQKAAGKDKQDRPLAERPKQSTTR